MFFFCCAANAQPLDLAVRLFEKGEWELCRRECQRARIAHTEPAERFSLLDAMCLVRTGGDPHIAAGQFERILESGPDRQVAAMASYELGRLQWQADEPTAALDSFQTAFHSTTNKPLFLHSACSMYQLFQEFPELKAGQKDLLDQIETSRSQWYGALFAATAKPAACAPQSAPPNWIVRFYRAQIGPAIGNRCVLEPSCSEYFNQAHRKHGMKSFPMTADRFFREPEVSNQKRDPVVTRSGQIRYRDPVENHDYWMKK